MFVSENLSINENGHLTIGGVDTVELAKEYSDDKVKNMINAVLDKIYHGDNKDE